MHVCCSPLAVVAVVITFLAALIVAQTIFALVLTTIAAAAPARTTGAALILLSIAGGYRERGEYDSEDLHLSFLLLGALITVAPLNNGISSARCLLLRKSLRLAWSMSKIQIYSCRHFFLSMSKKDACACKVASYFELRVERSCRLAAEGSSPKILAALLRRTVILDWHGLSGVTFYG